MNKLNPKFLIIPIFILLVLLFIYFLLIFSNKILQKNPNLPFSPSPTTNKLIISPTPTLIPPAFTGAAEDPGIPQEELDMSMQIYNLRKKTPLKQNNFSIFFDYSLDAFNVVLEEPKDMSQASFSAWLKNSYPAIPEDRFKFQ